MTYNLNSIRKSVRRGRSNFRLFTWAGGTAKVFQWLAEGPFAILSASRSERTPEENRQATFELKERLIADGKGFYPADGFYVGREIVSEDSVFVPGVTLAEALEYGKMFDPPQWEVIWGDKGKWAFYRVEDGKSGPIGDIKNDFTILSDREISKLETEGDKGGGVGFTSTLRSNVLPFTLDPAMKKKREEWSREKAEDIPSIAPYSEDREKTASSGRKYVLVSDPRYHAPMGNFSLTASCVVKGKDVEFSGYFYGPRVGTTRIGTLLAMLPV